MKAKCVTQELGLRVHRWMIEQMLVQDPVTTKKSKTLILVNKVVVSVERMTQ